MDTRGEPCTLAGRVEGTGEGVESRGGGMKGKSEGWEGAAEPASRRWRPQHCNQLSPWASPERASQYAGRQCGAARARPASAVVADQASSASCYGRQTGWLTGRGRLRRHGRPAGRADKREVRTVEVSSGMEGVAGQTKQLKAGAC